MKYPVWILPFIASPAFACPTAADLANGIKVTQTDATHIYKTLDDTTIRRVTIWEDGSESRTNLLYGAYPVHSVWLDEGVIDSWSIMAHYYETPPPMPSDGLIWKSEADVFAGIETYLETVSARWGFVPFVPDKGQIGDCAYESVSGTLTYENPYDTITQRMAYLPALGFALEVSYQYDQATPETFQFIAIEAVE